MRFSAWLNNNTPWDVLLGEAGHVSATGWDGIWVADHFMPNEADNSGPTQEAWSILAGFATSVPNGRLGTLVTGNTYRNPAVLAKQVAQVDIMSGGRAILGIGAGWQLNEHQAYGIEYSDIPGRLKRLEEAVQIFRSLFDNERTTFKGKYYDIVDAPLAPKPAQSHLPILIGGGGEKVTLRITAQYADEWNVWGVPERIQAKAAILDEHCARLGRDPKSIKRTAQVLTAVVKDGEKFESPYGPNIPMLAASVEEWRDAVGRYRDAGVDELIVPDFIFPDGLEARCESFDRFREEVAAGFR